MKILIALTYYRPHVSGLTIYVERLARALSEKGHEVSILTSRYDPALPREEVQEGVRIIRVPVALRVSKGVIMPTIGLEATRRVREHDVVSLHLPQLDAAGVALRGRLMKKPTVVTYHSDLRLPPGAVNWLATRVVDLANRATAVLADAVVAYTEDFATHSPYLSRYYEKIRVISPPVEVVPVEEADVVQFEQDHVTGKPRIGMAARLATEKGVEYLLKALPTILDHYPQAEVLFAGPYQNVLGEEKYARSLSPLLEPFSNHWRFLGTLSPAQMTAFYRACDVTVLPSVNNTETFGLVQIESMICGTPVVASNLPGVRQPIMMTGMGKVVAIRDAPALAHAILDILAHPDAYMADSAMISRQFSPSRTADSYLDLFSELLKR